MAQTFAQKYNKMSDDELDRYIRTMENRLRKRGRALENPASKYKSVYAKGTMIYQKATSLFRAIYSDRLTGKKLENATRQEKLLRIKNAETYLKTLDSSIERIRQSHRRYEKKAGRKLTPDEVFILRQQIDNIPESSVASDYIFEAVLALAGQNVTHYDIINLAKEKFAEDIGMLDEYAREAEEFTNLY